MKKNDSSNLLIAKENLAKMNLTVNFLFEKVMSDPEAGQLLCRIILETVLQRPVGEIRISSQKSYPGLDQERRGIRLDVYVEEATNKTGDEPIASVYDIEPDNNSGDVNVLPQRVRFYRAKMDEKFLRAGNEYGTLPAVYIIMILTYDPFGRNRMVYTVKNTCLEVPDLSYEDGARNLFLYCMGTEGSPSEELRNLLHYIMETKEENALNDRLKQLHQVVDRVRHDEEVSISYMKYYEELEDARKKGKAEGRVEDVRNLMESMKLTAEQAVDALKIEGNERLVILDSIIELQTSD